MLSSWLKQSPWGRQFSFARMSVFARTFAIPSATRFEPPLATHFASHSYAAIATWMTSR